MSQQPQQPPQRAQRPQQRPQQQPQQRPQQRQQRRRRPNSSTSADCCRVCCGPCDNCSDSCNTSILFAGFLAFYVVSFLWDIFVILGGYSALSIAQKGDCVNRSGFENISPELVLVLLFVACFHAISLVWIIGFMHSKAITNRWLGAEIVDVPREWPRICGIGCDWAICVPGTVYEALLIIQFGLSVYVYSFLDDLMEVEPEDYVEHFCVGLEEAEMAQLWMQLSLLFFIMTVIMACVYGCLIRIGTNDVSILEPGQQRIHNRRPPNNDIQNSDNQPLNRNQNRRNQQQRRQ